MIVYTIVFSTEEVTAKGWYNFLYPEGGSRFASVARLIQACCSTATEDQSRDLVPWVVPL